MMRLILCGMVLVMVCGCGKHAQQGGQTGAGGLPKVTLTLDWRPEPEFGGFYEAQRTGAFAAHGLEADLKIAGEGKPTWQLVAEGKTEFATTAADQVIIARSQGADIVAIYAVYQTFPQGIMVHAARHFTSIRDVFESDGLLLAEDDTWLRYLRNKFGTTTVKVGTYDQGIGDFLAKADCSQQCFVTSEPIIARHEGGDPQTFLIADEGYNPYTTVVICTGDFLRSHPDEVKGMAAACRAGWRGYLDDPKATNVVMNGLTPDMDLGSFGEAAAAQKPLIETAETEKSGLGTMTLSRWETLEGELESLKVIENPVKAGDCFVNP